MEDWARKNEFEQIFDHLITQLSTIGPSGEDWRKEILQMEGRYNGLKRNIRMGTIDDRDRIVETNQIRANILDAIITMKKQFG